MKDHAQAFRDVALLLRLAADDYERLADDFDLISLEETVERITRITLQTERAFGTAIRDLEWRKGGLA